jgi:nicotinamide-nucleotide amidase
MSAKIEIIAVGDELLGGYYTENNSTYISMMLGSVGIAINRISVVPDEAEIIADALTEAMSRSDVVIVTGGLGPTTDDVTREAAITALGGGVEMREDILETIERRYGAYGKEAPNGYRRHMAVPSGAVVLANNVGAVPGLKVDRGGKLLYLLPGVPAEMKAMFTSSVLPDLTRFGAGRTLILRTYGLSEGEVEERLQRVLEESQIRSLSIISSVTGVDCYLGPGMWGEGTHPAVERELGSFLYATGNLKAEEICVKLLTDTGTTLATAESVTGGLLASRIVGVPGASEVFLEGFITYSNKAKIERLGVSKEFLESRGAVSEEICVQMAEGARERTGSDLAMSTTGIAGPGGATEAKPVGYCFIGLATAGGSYCVNVLLSGGREAVRGRAASIAIDLLRLELQGHSDRLDPLRVEGNDGRPGS